MTTSDDNQRAGSDPEAEVDFALRRAGLSVLPEERARFIRLYPLLQACPEQIRLPETRDAEPALIFPMISDP